MSRTVSVVGAYSGLSESAQGIEDEEELQELQEEKQKQSQKLTKLQNKGFKESLGVSWSKSDDMSSKIINALSTDLKQELINSFDCEADYDLQKGLVQYYKQHGTTGISNSELKNGLTINGKKIEVKTEQKKTEFYNEVSGDHNGEITVFTFSDPTTGAEIKIADANGNGVIETEELLFNELLTDINTAIVDSSDSELQGIENEGPDLTDFLDSDKKEKVDENSSNSENEDIFSKEEIEEIKQEKISEIYDEIIKNNPDINIYDARLQAENEAEKEIAYNYTQNSDGTYTKKSDFSGINI